jgi:CHAT domain-containing protein
LGGPAHPLADDWTIDVAPSLGFLLAPSAAASSPPKTGRAVIGLTFAKPNRFGLPPIKSSASEAAAVAATLGVAPILDDAATKSAVLAALGRSRYAHISTHGRHAVVAPGFQTIFCADDGAGDDGRLHAYEILALDLRGLELLTLSACETALGRYDLGDNLRGLPATFFLAGVQTIVATLWPVERPAAATFFPAFYTAIEGGASQRNAFAAAQAKTRSAFRNFAPGEPST